jgi:hypothetical protein
MSLRYYGKRYGKPAYKYAARRMDMAVAGAPAAIERLVRSEVSYQGKKALRAGAQRVYYGAPKHSAPKRKKVKTNFRLTSDVKSCKSALKILKSQSDASLGTFTYRTISGGNVVSAKNAQGVTGFNGNQVSFIDTVLTSVPIFDEDNPATLNAIDMTTGAYQRKILVARQSANLKLTNNGITSAELQVYQCFPKDDTNVSVIDAWSAAGTSGSAGTIALTTLMNSPNDYSEFRASWKIKRVFNGVIRAGESVSSSWYLKKPYEYDHVLAVAEADKYQSKYGAMEFMVIVNGTASHDTSSVSLVGHDATHIDSILERKMTIQYDAGINITQFKTVNSLGTLSAPVQSNKPVADNQAFSDT